ncbi:MBL fold metallo-hydrolase [Mesorhizobium sp. RP14(2022)]|uniref:MBL fold metallo-hydrolase n=1 Tax=Mesorhizobium liriopis TaxID=2953882 RepID=A0ABT1C2L1_9HYPH|nr:MBL fold metallo-hydrolase [Mesorhizobium liriopis]MCO6049067.1 MBL fold metallo-hydrolase [Mesorhizobium liriopis]
MTPPVDRRTAMKMGAGAVAVAGLSSVSAQAQTTQAQTTQIPAASGENSVTQPILPGSPGFHQFKFGEWEITAVLDGLRPGEGPHPTFGANQPAEVVEALMEKNFLPPRQMVNGFTPVLIRTGSEMILFDTGMGPGGRENNLGLLRARMGQAGFSPESVTLVVITHMHGDHIGGLMEGEAPAFPNASYVFGQKEWDFWTADERLEGPTQGNAQAVRKNVMPLRERAVFVSEGNGVAPGITAIEAFGHTPGHLIFRLESGGKTLMLTADTANHYVASLQKPDWEVRFDMDKAQAAATRKKVFGQIADERLPFIGYHMPFPALGYVERFEDGFRFMPETYQMEL